MSKSVKTLVTNVSQLKARLDWVVEMATRGLAAGPVEITLGRESKKRSQEAKYHVLINDINALRPAQSFEAWKCLLVKWFDEEMKEAGTPLGKPGERILDARNQEFVYLRPSTTDFRVGEAAQFIEYLNAFGAEHGVQWSKQSINIYSEYKESK